MSKIRVNIPNQDVYPGPVRKALVKHGSAWWRKNCNGAQGLNAHPRLSGADVRADVIRVKIDGVPNIGPTPEWIRTRVVEPADAGRAVQGGCGVLDLSTFHPMVTVRNDLDPKTGRARQRADGTVGGRKVRSDKGGTHYYGRGHANAA